MANASANIERANEQARRPTNLERTEAELIAGRYRLVRELAKGGMGRVWMAEDTRLEGLVALKFMLDDALRIEGAELRFAREARAAVRLAVETDYVVKVIDYGVDRSRPYIAMELLSGENLAERLARVGRLSPDELCPIARQTASALKRAHRMALVHRDIKPENIFLVARDEEERVKILDFGIVKELTPSTLTRSGEIFGTLCYMSPEQIQDLPVDHRSDLWSLAVVLYQALTGRLPFEEQSIGQLLMSICQDAFPLPSEVAPDLTGEVDAFFARAFERSPARRFQSAAELSHAFAELARGSFPPPSSLPDRALGTAATLPLAARSARLPGLAIVRSYRGSKPR